MIVRITASSPVRYSLNNGVSLMEYAPGEVYEVPDWAAASMIKRSWAKALTADDLKEAADTAEQTEVDLSSLRKVEEKQQRKRKQEDEP